MPPTPPQTIPPKVPTTTISDVMSRLPQRTAIATQPSPQAKLINENTTKETQAVTKTIQSEWANVTNRRPQPNGRPLRRYKSETKPVRMIAGVEKIVPTMANNGEMRWQAKKIQQAVRIWKRHINEIADGWFVCNRGLAVSVSEFGLVTEVSCIESSNQMKINSYQDVLTTKAQSYGMITSLFKQNVFPILAVS